MNADVLSQQQQAMLGFVRGVGQGRPMYWEHLFFGLPVDEPEIMGRTLVHRLWQSHPALRGAQKAGKIVPLNETHNPAKAASLDEARQLIGSLSGDAEGPLLRSVVIASETLGGAPVLWLAIHHLVTDGWSQQLIEDSINSSLAGELPKSSPHSYGQWAAEQRTWWDTARDEYRAHFLPRLSDATWQTGVRGHRVQGPVEKPAAAWCSRTLEVSPSNFGEACRALRTTPAVLATTAWFDSALAHINRPIVATHVANRDTASRSTVGYFANAILLAPHLGNLSTREERLQAVREELTAGLRFQKAHVDTVSAELLGHNDPYTMLFTLTDNRRKAANATCRLETPPDLTSQDETTRRDLCVYVEIGARVRVDALFRVSAYDAKDIDGALSLLDREMTLAVTESLRNITPRG